ncbi:MAG: carbohydrate ABC transporter permease [Treponema sp.]|jgi:putative aldouronate transport system permease protein|nr:carbohydrate ABC transporter permease [Treponema sp.]
MMRRFSLVDFMLLLIMGFFALVCAFPFYQTAIISLSRAGDLEKQIVYLVPSSIDASAYGYLFQEGKLPRGFLVTVFITVVGTALNMVVTTAGAYALTKKDLPGRNFFFNMIIVTMFISGGLIPYFLTVRALGLMNSIWVMIIPGAVGTFNLILMKNFFNTLPAELEESAKMDGANEIYILIRIIIPISAPIMATIALFYAVGHWNEWWTAMIFINNTKLYPLQLVLRDATLNLTRYFNDNWIAASMAEGQRTYYGESVKAAMIMITAIPILLVYPFLQKHFTKGIMIGSIKG